MRKFLQILGALTLVIVLAVGIGLAVVIHKGRALDAESKAFVDAAVLAIAENWSKEQLLARATPELRESVKPDELSALFGAFSRLGALVVYEGAMGQATMSYFAGSGGAVSATYVAKGRFQRGNATFRIVLLNRDRNWMIHNFRVDPAPANRAGQGI